MVALLALLLTGQMVKAADYTVFPSAVPVGGSVNAIVSGSNAASLTGCAVSLPEVGCSLVHTVSVSQMMVRLTAGANALGGRTEPIRGSLRLTFGSSSQILSNAVAVGTPEQVGVAMLAPHANPPAAAPKPQVIYRTTQVVRPDPALIARVGELERWRTAVTTPPPPPPPAPVVVVPAPAPPTPVATPAPQTPPTPAPVASAEFVAIRQQLGVMQTSIDSQGRRIDGLVGQVGNLQGSVTAVDANQRKLVDGVSLVAGQTAKNTRNKGDRCGFIADLQAKGFTVQNPHLLGCK